MKQVEERYEASKMAYRDIKNSIDMTIALYRYQA